MQFKGGFDCVSRLYMRFRLRSGTVFSYEAPQDSITMQRRALKRTYAKKRGNNLKSTKPTQSRSEASSGIGNGTQRFALYVLIKRLQPVLMPLCYDAAGEITLRMNHEKRQISVDEFPTAFRDRKLYYFV